MFDVHVHSGPDVLDRWDHDIATVLEYAAAGFTGCVLKCHYESTVGRAAAASRATGLTVYGGLVLNNTAGGINPSAVYAALAAGARVIWLPTEDCHTQAAAGLHRLCGHDARLSSTTLAVPPLDTSTAAALDLIFTLVAEADAVLATGHLSGVEVRWVVAQAMRRGVRRVLLTHPTFTVPAMTVAEAVALAELGVYVELTGYQLLHQPGCSPHQLAKLARAVPPERLVLSSDAGQPNSPAPPQALYGLIDALASVGVDRGLLRAAVADHPEQLIRP